MKLPTSMGEVLKHNAEHAGGSRLINYQGLILAAPMSDIRDAVTLLKNSNRRERKGIIASVNRSLARNFPKVKAQKASQKVTMSCAQDLTIWYANEIVEGRASEEVH